jgi:tetratricopeptide (TPR) repeat protein
MNQRLSTWLWFGALLVSPLTARGQEAIGSTARRTILDAPSFKTDDLSQTSRGTGPSVSARELSIPERARSAYSKGIHRLSKNDPAGSVVHFQRATSRFPTFYEAYYAMGVAQLTLGHAEEAQQAFQKSIEASNGLYAEPHFGLSALLCNQQKFTEAEPIIRKALELAPGSGPGHSTLAWALLGLNRLDESEKNAQQALIREPRLSLAHLVLASIYKRRGDDSAVLAEVDAYLRLTSDGALRDQARLIEESLKRKLARSVVIVVAPPARP